MILIMGFCVRSVIFVVLELGILGVTSEKPSVVKIGALFSYDSVIGKGAKLAMEMAVEDVKSNPSVLNGTDFQIVMEDSGCNVFMGSLKALKVIEKEVVAIIGPQSSAIARIVSDIGKGLQLPVISYAATNPALSSIQFPYFLRSGPSDLIQIAAIATIVDFYKWKEIIAVFVDNEYGQNAVNSLANELTKRMAKISHKLPLSPGYNATEITDTLNRSKMFGPRVYVVHLDPDPRLNFFKIAKELNMFTENYVWLATDWFSSTLDSLPGDTDFVKILQGIVTLRPHIPDTVYRKAFKSRWKRMQRNNSSHYTNYTAYGLYAYDTVWLVAHSINRFLEEHGRIAFTFRNHFRNLKDFDGGEFLRSLILDSSFTGLTGQVLFDSDRNRMNIGYEIINVVQGKILTVGYWSNQTGLSIQPPESMKKNESVISRQGWNLDKITWPGGGIETPRGWVVASTEKPLRIGFPRRVSFSEFITDVNRSNVHGYCIDLFDDVLKMVPFDVPFKYVPFGDGLKNPSYDELVRMVAEDVLDAAIGDIAIVTNRIKMVDFTQPFIGTGLVIVAPVEHLTSSGWVFVKPFTLEMWCAIAAFFVVIGVVMWMLEHRVNDDFRGPPRRQLKTIFLFSCSTLFRGQKEKTVSMLGKFVMVVWLFLLLVVTSSYTANLSSILTVQQLSTSIKGIDDLVSSGHPIGYQVGSFAYSYMMNSLNVNPSRLISLGSPEEFEVALRKGPSGGGVAAIVDETPYVELFLSDQTDFGIVGQPFTKSGWGFAFKKGSPLAIDVSTAILKLAENGVLEKLHYKWFCKKGCPGEQRKSPEPNKLHLSSFWALYSICGAFALIVLFIFLTRVARQYIRYKRQHMDPSSTVLSRAIWNFFNFVDEKEETIKKVFTQRDKSSNDQVTNIDSN